AGDNGAAGALFQVVVAALPLAEIGQLVIDTLDLRGSALLGLDSPRLQSRALPGNAAEQSIDAQQIGFSAGSQERQCVGFGEELLLPRGIFFLSGQLLQSR